MITLTRIQSDTKAIHTTHTQNSKQQPGQTLRSNLTRSQNEYEVRQNTIITMNMKLDKTQS